MISLFGIMYTLYLPIQSLLGHIWAKSMSKPAHTATPFAVPQRVYECSSPCRQIMEYHIVDSLKGLSCGLVDLIISLTLLFVGTRIGFTAETCSLKTCC